MKGLVSMAKVIAICNQKGGVGKTVTTVNLGIGLARAEKKVLLVDMDAQASLTLSLGYQPEQIEMTIASIMGQYMSESNIKSNVFKSILHHKEKVDLLPSNIELSGLEAALVNTMSRETVLRNSLKVLRDKYDYIVVDCSPSLGMLTINSLAFADTVLIPVQAQYLSIKGLEQLIKTISRVQMCINRKLDISGILITMANMRTNYSKELVTLLHQNYDRKLHIFQEYIPMSVKAAEISAEGTSIYTHDKNGKVAKAYESFVQEVLTWQKRMKMQKK